MEAKAKKIHTGQYRPYGDAYSVWEVTADGEFEEVLAWCKKELMGGTELPLESEFLRAWRNGEMSIEDYFKGFYKLTKYYAYDNEWRFTHVRPFTD